MAATQVRASKSEQLRLPGVHLDWRHPAAQTPWRSGIALFIGWVSSEQAHPPRVFTRWDACRTWLGQRATGYLDYAVRGFFENGGSRCWVLALPAPADRRAAAQALIDSLRPGGPLEDLPEPDLLCLPDAAWQADAVELLAVQRAAMDYCDRMNDRMAILDCLAARPDDAQLQDRPRSRARLPWFHALPDLARVSRTVQGVVNAAQYWPWVRVPALPRHGVGQVTDVPPCGHVAGMYARVDAREGRHKAPANETLEGVFDVDDEIQDEALAELNDDGANSLRALPGSGVRVCGARLLSNHPDWRYIGGRRVLLGLVRWAETGLADLVMEPLQPALWERIRQRLDSYCLAQYRAGALRGGTPREAYVVKCDAETNPPESTELGQVVCHVGLAITAPAEFVVVQLVRAADGTAFTG